MEITPKKIDNLNTELAITLTKDDYYANYENALKRYKKQVNMPGFRPGHVPMSLVKKQYGKAVLAEELNRVLNDKLYEYIVTEKLNVLGNPIPAEGDDIEGNWDEPDTFTFRYEIGLAPEIEIEKSMKKVPARHTVKIDKKLIDRHVEDLTRRHGGVTDVEKSAENDLILGNFVELDSKGEIIEGGITSDSSIALEYVEDKKTKKALTGLSKGATVTVDPHNVSRSHEDLAKMLGITHDDVHDLKSSFKFTVNEIKRLNPHEVNQELFDKVFGKDEIQSEEAFRAKLQDQLKDMFERDSMNVYKRQLSEHILDHLDAPLPDSFLKRWIQLSNDKPIDAAQVEAEYPDYSRFLRWQLVEGKVMRDHDLQVTEEDIRAQAKAMIGAQYAQYGMPLDEEMLENFATNVLGDRNERQRIADVLKENKVLDTLIANAKIKEKEVSYDDFMEIANGHRH